MKNSDANRSADSSSKNNNSRNIYFALFSGILFFLSFPKFGLGFIAWIALVPLFIALRDTRSIGRALLLGWVAGLTACVGIVYWIAYVVVQYGYLPFYLGLSIMLLLACYLGLYFALFAAGIVYFKRKVPLFIVAPTLWVCLEYVKSRLFTGFPWENLGYSQFNNILLIQIADVTGIFGLSLLIVLLNVAFFEIVTKRSKKSFALAAIVVLLWSCVYVYGVLRIAEIDKVLKAAQTMNVTLIQGNIDQSIKWNKDFQKETINIYEELSLRRPQAGGSLLVWPETAVPFNFQDENDLHRQLRALPVKTNSWFIFGSMSYARRSQGLDYFNSAYLLSPQGLILGKYDKVHLVPYGEYVPFRELFPFVNGLTAGIGDFTEGKGFSPLNMGERKIGVLICYEGILPEAARAYKNAGSELLVNITNDAWFGSTSAPYQHLSMAAFRAVETRLYLVRAANTGISAIVDPTGKVVADTKLFKKDAIHGIIKFIALPTFYARYGDWPVGASFVCVVVLFVWSLTRRKRNVI